jgi:rhodanese-related sulfurtransferase
LSGIDIETQFYVGFFSNLVEAQKCFYTENRKSHPTDPVPPIACICRSGGRSRAACEELAGLGFTQLQNVKGGMMAWERAKLPVAK